MRKEGLPAQKVAQSDTLRSVAEAMHYADLDTLHAAVGEGHVSAKAVVQRLAAGVAGRRGATARHHGAATSPGAREQAARHRCAR